MKNVETKKSATSRDFTIDIVRGIAIFTMVGANMAPLLAEPHSEALRYYSSFAAPIFVSLAGTMIAFGAQANSASQNISYMLKRGFFLMLVAATIDVLAWSYFPFIGMDVLYLIGLILPVLFLLARANRVMVLMLGLTVFLLTPVMQKLFGYALLPYSPSIWAPAELKEIGAAVILKHWVVDGWFPIFPWLGYGLVGISIGQWRFGMNKEETSRSSNYPILLAFGLISVGLMAMQIIGGPFYSRAGYSELFYPSTLGFVSLSVGVVIGLIALVDKTLNYPFWNLFRPLGEASLFMYLLHSLVIGMVLMPIFGIMSTATYLVCYALFMVSLFFLGYRLRDVRKQIKHAPIIVKWVIGG